MKIKPLTRSNSKGLSLVELLIALILGLLITLAAGSVYIVARQGFQTNDDRSRTLENGRLAIDILTRNIRMSGAYAFDAGDPLSPTDWDKKFPAIVSLVGVEGGANPDSVSISYESTDAYNAAFLAGADCLGQNIGAATLTNTFALSAAPNRQLTCSGSAAPANIQPIVSSIEDLQLTYTLVTNAAERTKPDSDFPVVSIIDASAVPAGRWQDVRQVHICVDAASFEPNTIDGATPGLNCRGAAFPADNRVHRIFRTTVNVRNSTRGGNINSPGSGLPYP